MAVNSKNKKAIITGWITLAVLLSLLLSFLYVNANVHVAKDHTRFTKTSQLTNSSKLSQFADGLKTTIARVVILNSVEAKNIKNWEVKDEVIRKLDFSLGTNGDPDFKIFSPEGGGNVTPDDFFQGWNKELKVYFTSGNRARGAKTNKADLMLIVSNLNEAECKGAQALSVQKRNSAKINIKTISKINLTPHPIQVPESEVIGLPSKNGCLKTPDGYFYYHVLVER